MLYIVACAEVTTNVLEPCYDADFRFAGAALKSVRFWEYLCAFECTTKNSLVKWLYH